MTRNTETLDAEAAVAALADLREELQENPVEETRLAELYEEVSTSPPQLWNRATAFVECEIPNEVRNLDEASGEERPASSGGSNEVRNLDEASGEGRPASSEDDAQAEQAVAIVTDVSKLARGWWAPEIVEDCDAMITIDVRAGLPAETFVNLATAELDEQIEAIRSGEDIDQGPPL